MTYSAISASLESARSRSDLIAAAQRIQYVESLADRDRLGAIVKRRLDEFKQRH